MGDLRVGWLNLDGYQTPNDTRLVTQMAWMGDSSGPLLVRSGLVGGPDAAQLTGATAMEADIDPFAAIIAGSEAGDQGAYPVVLRAQKRLTFTAGEPAINRVDQVIAHVYDNDYDATGTYDGDVEVIVGDSATGAAAELPPDSLPLWEVTVPAGASAGGSGIPWASAVQSARQWTTTLGGALPVADKDSRDAIFQPPAGMSVVRLDLGVIETFDGTWWRTQGIPVLAGTADTSKLDQYDGQAAVIGEDFYTRRSGAWVAQPRGLLAVRQSFTGWPNGATDGTLNTIAVVGSAWPNAGGQTLPMQFDIDVDPARTYRLTGFIDIIDTDSEALFRASIKRGATTADITAGSTVSIQYGYVPAAILSTGPAVNMVGYLSGDQSPGVTRFAMCLEPYRPASAPGSGNLRTGGVYSLAIEDVGPAGALTNG